MIKLFAKPNLEGAFPKISYAGYFQPWNWVIGTGVYVDDVDSAFAAKLRTQLMLDAVVLLIASLVAWRVSRSIGAPLLALAGVTDRIGAGRYDVAVPAIERADEIGTVALGRDSAQGS